MTYVAITGRLESEIRMRIRAMREAEARSEKPPSQPTFTGSEPWSGPKFWGPLWGTTHMADPKLVTKPFVARTVQVMIMDAPRPAPIADDSFFTDFTFNMAGLPRHALVDSDGRQEYYLRLRVKRADHPFFDQLAEHMGVQQEIAARWDKIDVEVRDFLHKCPSLNKALELWPDLRRYCSQEDLTKVETKTAKPKRDYSAAEAKLKAMDLDTIATSTVIARLASADKGGPE